MEPRPPRTRPAGPAERTSRTPEGGARSTTAVYPGAQPEATTYGPAGQPGYAGAPPVATEIPLLPRQQRRRRRLIQTALAGMLVLGGIVGAGYYFLEDRLTDDDPAPRAIAASTPTPVATAPPVGATAPTVAEPTEPSSGGVAAVATATATAPAAEPTAAPAAPTEPPARASRPTRRATEPAPDPGDTGEPLPIEELLLTAEEAPADLPLAQEATERAEEDVIASLGTEDAAAQLETWGWQGNSFVQFQDPNPDALPPGSTSTIDVSIHRFADDASAAEALVYFSDQVVAAQGLEEIAVDTIGDGTRVLKGLSDQGAALVVAYVQDGVDLIRVGGTSNTEDGDPTEDVLAAAEAVVAK